jgi:hypothetical protein
MIQEERVYDKRRADGDNLARGMGQSRKNSQTRAAMSRKAAEIRGQNLERAHAEELRQKKQP